MSTRKLKPFNLESALNGGAVMLRDGHKAYIRHHETKLRLGDSVQLLGVILSESGVAALASWSNEGHYNATGDVSSLDIVGMWVMTHIVNGFEVPAPEVSTLKPGTSYWTVDFIQENMCIEYDWHKDSIDYSLLRRGLIFLRKEDAIANAKAMIRINPYEKRYNA